jgi:hypothetical protein
MLSAPTGALPTWPAPVPRQSPTVARESNRDGIVAILLENLRREDDAGLFCATLVALARIAAEDERVAATLLDFLRDGGSRPQDARIATALALGNFEDPRGRARSGLAATFEDRRSGAILRAHALLSETRIVVRRGSQEWEPLLHRAIRSLSDRAAVVREASVVVLGEIAAAGLARREEILPLLARISTRSSRRAERVLAAFALADAGDPSALDALRPARGKPTSSALPRPEHPPDRVGEPRTLGSDAESLVAPGDVPSLLGRLRDSPSALLRASAADGLVRLADPLCVPHLASTARDRSLHPHARSLATLALAALLPGSPSPSCDERVSLNRRLFLRTYGGDLGLLLSSDLR